MAGEKLNCLEFVSTRNVRSSLTPGCQRAIFCISRQNQVDDEAKWEILVNMYVPVLTG